MAFVSAKTVREAAQACGLHLYGWSAPTLPPPELARLSAWQSNGLAGEMKFMEREPAAFGDARRLLPNARSVLLFAIRYSAAPAPECPTGFGRIARYAWGRDYHTVLRERLLAVMEMLGSTLSEPLHYRVFSDAVPLLERAFGAQAGLGFVGKNTLLIRPRVGSYTFIAEVVSNLDVGAEPLPIVSGRCGECFRCGERCPTGAIAAPYKVDARRCISYLTIEKRSALQVEERRAIGEWLFGCDICQDVCPFNHAARREEAPADLDDFESAAGPGPLLPLHDILRLGSEGAFRRVFSGTALMRGRRKTLVRNAVIVAANTGAVALARTVAYLAERDANPLVRRHALWSLWVLERDFVAGVVDAGAAVDRALRDPDSGVQAEAQALAEGVL